VPALVPRAQSLAGEVFVTSGEHHFAVSANDGRIALSLHASRLFYDRAVPASQGNRALRGTRALVTENEGIWSASWMEHGVAYTLELECARHDDARCAGDRHLVALAEGLSYVGGAGGGP
jgi:ribose 1,5-bisphosphokinase PhnN